MTELLSKAIVDKKIELVRFQRNWKWGMDNAAAAYTAQERCREELLVLETLFNLHYLVK